MTGIFSQINLLNNALSGSHQSHRATSGNIANVNTPGYKTQRLDFAELLDRLDSTEAERTSIGDLPTHAEEGLPERVDGNNVDLEREISELKKNAMSAEAFAQLLASRLSTMRRAISG